MPRVAAKRPEVRRLTAADVFLLLRRAPSKAVITVLGSTIRDFEVQDNEREIRILLNEPLRRDGDGPLRRLTDMDTPRRTARNRK